MPETSVSGKSFIRPAGRANTKSLHGMKSFMEAFFFRSFSKMCYNKLKADTPLGITASAFLCKFESGKEKLKGMLLTDKDSIRYEMLEKPIGRLLFDKSCPTIIIQLISVIYNTADTYFVAKINTESSAAVGVVFSLMSIIQAVGFGIGMGANSLISRSLGAQNNKRANTYASSAVFSGVLFGTLLMITGLQNLNLLMRLIGASETVLPYAASYARYILIGAPFMCVSFVLNNILKAEGQAFFAMIGMTTGGILNLFLDPLLIFGFHMSIGGAAVATMISQITSAVIMYASFARGKSIVQLRFGFISKDPSDYLRIAKTGTPTIFRQGLGSVSSAILNIQAGVYGDAAVAAISIANKIYMLIRHVIMGIGQGYQPIAGYCYGAKKNTRVRQAFRLSCMAGTAICLFFSVLVFFFRVPIITWFRGDEAVVAIGSSALLWFCMSIPLMAYSTYVNQTYQCLGFSVAATLLASCRQGIFFIPLAFILPRWIGLTGIEMLQPAADVLTFLISVPFQIVFFRKYLKDAN
jgi:putative MATE family efflux protein